MSRELDYIGRPEDGDSVFWDHAIRKWRARQPAAGTGAVDSVVAGDNVTVDSSDPANPIVSATSGASGLAATTTLHVTSAQLLALTDTAPLEVVPAPGAGKFIYPLYAAWSFVPVTTPYTIPSGIYPCLTTTAMWGGGPFGGLWYETPAAGLLDSVVPVKFVGFQAAGENMPTPLKMPGATVENQALLFQNDRAGNYTDGDGTLDVSVTYFVCDI